MKQFLRLVWGWIPYSGVLFSSFIGALDTVAEGNTASATSPVDETNALTQTQKEWANKVQEFAKSDLSRMESDLASVFPLDCWTGMLRGPIAGCQTPASLYRMSPCSDGISRKQLEPCTYETYDQCSADALKSFWAQSVRQSVESARSFASRIPDIQSTIANCVSKMRQLVSDYRREPENRLSKEQEVSLVPTELSPWKRALYTHKNMLKQDIKIPSAAAKGKAGITQQISLVINGKRQVKRSQKQLLNASTVSALQYPIFRSVAKAQDTTEGTGPLQKTVFDSSVASVMTQWKKNVFWLQSWVKEVTNVTLVFQTLNRIKQRCNEAKAKGLDCVDWQEDEVLAALITSDVVAYYDRLANALDTVAKNLSIIQPIVEQHCQNLESAVAQSLESLGSEEFKGSVERAEA